MASYPVLIRRRTALGPTAPDVTPIEARANRFRLQPDTSAVTVDSAEYQDLVRNPAVDVFPDVRLSTCSAWNRVLAPADAMPGLERVMQLISAPSAWQKSRGRDVYLAIVDTGICGTMPQFPDAKKADGWAYDNSDPWDDYDGHGSMTACIAAAGEANGIGPGVAPEAFLYSCKTTFLTSELIAAYEWLMRKRAEHGRPIVINNSFAFFTGTAPQENGHTIDVNHPFVTAIQQAIAAGLVVVFAAGNNHELCSNADTCAPSSIWIWNSLDDVLSVGAVDQTNQLWSYSSRGPGQWASAISPKPDCVAPAFGEVMWKCGFKNMPQGWGTSGAAPQAAGLAALIASYKPDLSPKKILDCIRASCDAHPSAPTCSGNGVINCDKALSSLQP